MNVLITGGAGFIGSHLVDQLMKRGENVTVVDNLCLGKKEHIFRYFKNPNFKFYELDITDKSNMNVVFQRHQFDRIYHLAANSDIQKGGKNPNIDIHDTFATTLVILQLMRKYNVKNLLFSSTSAVYGDKRELLAENIGPLEPISYYGGAKLASEAFISSFAAMCDMSVNIIRFPNVVGERLTHGVIYDFIKKLKTNPKELEILGDGNQEKPYIYIHDLVEAILFLPFDHMGIKIFNAGVDTATTVKRIADIVCEEMGLVDVQYNYTGGSIGWKGDVSKFQYDLSKIHQTGWTAKYTSDEAVRFAAKDAVRS